MAIDLSMTKWINGTPEHQNKRGKEVGRGQFEGSKLTGVRCLRLACLGLSSSSSL